MPEGDQEHGRVALAVAIAAGGLNQLPDLTLSQVFTRSKLGIWTAQPKCPFGAACRDEARRIA